MPASRLIIPFLAGLALSATGCNGPDREQAQSADNPLARVQDVRDPSPATRAEAIPPTPEGWTVGTEQVRVVTPEEETEKRITYYTNSVGMKLVHVPPGTYRTCVHSEGHAPVRPSREVKVEEGFYVAAHEVTVAQFRQFVEATGYRTEAERGTPDLQDGQPGGYTVRPGTVWGWHQGVRWRDPGFEQADDHPVVLVSYNDAMAYLRWLSRKDGRPYRLPYSSEWEYACRAGTTTAYSWGDEFDPTRCNFGDEAEDGHARTAPVGTYTPNAWGLHNMHGNVSEWVTTWVAMDGHLTESYMRQYEDPTLRDETEDLDPETERAMPSRMARGGNWRYPPILCPSCAEGVMLFRDSATGFRVMSPVASGQGDTMGGAYGIPSYDPE